MTASTFSYRRIPLAAQVLIIVLAVFLCYSTTFFNPFIFDDYNYIVNNPAIQNFDCFPDTGNVLKLPVHPDVKNNLILRPLTYFTFALNYRIHGLSLFGYHLVSIILHSISASLVFIFMSQLTTLCRRNGDTSHSGYAPLLAALLFACHPLQTQAVNYIIQRFVPMVTCFYLATLILYLSFRTCREQNRRWPAYFLALMCTLLAMESKEIAFTLPVMLVVMELVFFEGNLARRLAVLVPFFMTMVIIPAKLMQLSSLLITEKSSALSNAINLVNFDKTASHDYFMTQLGVIVKYLSLLLLPINQNFDYDYHLQKDFFSPQVIIPLVIFVILVGIALYLLTQKKKDPWYKLVGFGLLWFFITLSVESSVVPIEQLIYEHRAYLPSIGIFIVAVAIFEIVSENVARYPTPLCVHKKWYFLPIGLVLVCSIATVQRNNVWRDEITFWSDVVSKSPGKGRAHLSLGEALLMNTGRATQENLQRAKKELTEAVRLDPSLYVSHKNLASIYEMEGNITAAINELNKVLALRHDKSVVERLTLLQQKKR